MNTGLRAIPALLLCMGAAPAFSAGFQLLEQNASGLGNAYAGSAAVAENASTIFYNPAGMSFLKGTQVSAGLTVVKPNFQFNNNGSLNPTAMGGTPATGGTSDAGNVGYLPNAYLSMPVNKDLSVGLGLGAPFGLMTEYSPGWAGQFQSVKFDIRTQNINPSVAWRVNDKLSLGFGVDWMRITAQYVKSTVVPTGLSSPYPPYASVPASVDLAGDAWGWNAGLMYQVADGMRIGLSYRSTVLQKTTGTASAGPAAGTASADVKLPDTWILSVYQVLNDRWDVMGDISRTGWSSIPQLVISSSLSPAPDALNLQFKNTWRVAFGGTYKYTDQWKLKFGIAYDQTPVPDASVRPASMPDNDRWWLSLGAQYRLSPAAVVDVGYTHLFLKDADIANNGSGNQATKGLISGSYSDSADILGVQYSQSF